MKIYIKKDQILAFKYVGNVQNFDEVKFYKEAWENTLAYRNKLITLRDSDRITDETDRRALNNIILELAGRLIAYRKYFDHF